MSVRSLAERNRANARKSTGPRTAAGKAVVARNAIRHGATCRPDPDRVATWLAIILDEPAFATALRHPVTERELQALRLAEVEARLAGVVRARQAFEIEAAERAAAVARRRKELEATLFESGPPVLAGAALRAAIKRFVTLGRRAVALGKEQDSRRRLFRRYLREAQAQRNKAFRAWIAVLRRETGGPAPGPSRGPGAGDGPGIPKQSQDRTEGARSAPDPSADPAAMAGGDLLPKQSQPPSKGAPDATVPRTRPPGEAVSSVDAVDAHVPKQSQPAPVAGPKPEATARAGPETIRGDGAPGTEVPKQSQPPPGGHRPAGGQCDRRRG